MFIRDSHGKAVGQLISFHVIPRPHTDIEKNLPKGVEGKA